ncbi:MAG: hypothetical protein ACLQU3_34615 [Limisphaerales bacterium]
MQFNIVRWRNGRRSNVDSDAGWEHPLGKGCDLVGLVEHGLGGIIHLLEQMASVVDAPKQLGTLKSVEER